MKFFATILVLLLGSIQPSAVQAQENHGTFTYNSMETGPRRAFFEKHRNLPNSYSVIRTDPFGGGGNGPVHRFEIRTGECGSPLDQGDCSYNAVRSELAENNHRGTRFGRIQPREAWYEWDIGFPDGFPFGPRQTRGYYLFGQWHNGVCPHMNFGIWGGRNSHMLHLRTSQIIPGHRHGDCQPDELIPVIDLREIEGRWAHFVVYVRWSTGNDGEVRVFVDGHQRVQFNGRTLIPEHVGRNHFDFGIYLANADSLRRVQPATLYYRDIRRTRQQPPM